MSCSLLENNVLRLRVPHLTGNFAEQDFLAEQAITKTTGKLAGIILDLRSADGDEAGLVSATNHFANQKRPLVILVNGRTRGAAAALAVDLRAAGDGLLVGSTNFSGAVKPDIAVAVAAEDELKFLADPFYVPIAAKPDSPADTNSIAEFVDHTSEADLVRQRVKDGEQADAATPRAKPSQPVIRDPALARALDFFKGLAALHQTRG